MKNSQWIALTNLWLRMATGEDVEQDEIQRTIYNVCADGFDFIEQAGEARGITQEHIEQNKLRLDK